MRGSPIRLTSLVCVAVFCLAGSASAVEWVLVGARQRGMGGAGVAAANECSAVYWNPASLRADTGWSAGWDTNFSIELAPNTLDQLTNLVDTIETLQTDFANLQSRFDALSDVGATPATDEDLATVLNLVLNHFSHLDRKDLGLLLDAGTNINVQAGTFGVGVGAVGYFDAGLVADIRGLALSAVPDDAMANLTNALEGVDLTAVPAVVDYTGTGLDTLAQDIEGILVTDGTVTPAEAETMTAAMLYVASYDPVTNPGENPLESQLDLLGIADNFAGADLTDPEVQSMFVDIVSATALGAAGTLVEENETGIHLRGAAVVEVAVAKSFTILKDTLSIGATAKTMTARTFNIGVTYADYSDATGVNDAMSDLTGQIQSQLVDDPLDSTQLGIDLGVDFKLNKFVRLAVVMKNLNRPVFDLPNSGDKFVLSPQVRAGIAVTPLPWTVVTFDLDLSENRSQIATDYGMRFYSLGAEVSVLKVLQLRAGVYGNLLAPEMTPAFTMGLGVKVARVFKLDIAANLNGDANKLMGMAGGGDLEVSDLPEGAGISLSMQFHTKF